MRRIVQSSLLISSVVVAAGSLAQTPKPAVSLRPPSPIPSVTLKPAQLVRPPSIAGARRALKSNGEPDTSLYTGGALSFEVEVVNPGSTALQTRLLIKSQL